MRRTEISITKAVGIILMVVGHSGCPKQISDIIYQFHMPLFFILSGMCLKEEHLDHFWMFFKRKIIGIWWPYVKYGTIFLLLHNVFFNLNIYSSEYGYMDNVSCLYTFQDFCSKFSKVIRMTWSEQLLGGFWFLHALFWGSIIGVVFLILLKRKYVVLGILLIIAVLMSVLKIEIPVIWITSTTFLSSTFFILGYCLKYVSLSNWIYPVSMFLLIAGVKWGAGSMHISDSLLIVPYVIVAGVSSLAIYKLSSMISMTRIKLDILTYVGDMTFPILIWHFLSFKIISLIIILLYDLPLNQLSRFPVIDEYSIKGWWVLYVFVGIIIPLIVGVLERYFSKVCKGFMFRYFTYQ